MKLGDYNVLKHPSFNIEEGEKINMFCPSCSENLKKHKVKATKDTQMNKKRITISIPEGLIIMLEQPFLSGSLGFK